MKQKLLQQFLDNLSTAKLIHYLLLFALGWAVVQLLAYFQTVITIFTFSAILAFLLNYPVRWLSRFVPHGIAAVAIFLLSLVILGGVIATLGSTILDQGQRLITQSPEIVGAIAPLLEQIEDFFGSLNFQVDASELGEELRGQLFSAVDIGLSILQGMLTNLVDLILIAVVAFFMLLDGGKVWDFMLKSVPVDVRDNLTQAIQANFLGFFWGRLLLSIFFAISCFIVFIILQVPYALVLAAIAGLFDLIPGIGATLGISLVSIILLPQGIWLSIQVLTGCVLLQQIEENLLMPRIMQGSINMNPVVLFFALLVGARVAGLFGIFLSIPIAGVIISLLELEDLKAES